MSTPVPLNSDQLIDLLSISKDATAIYSDAELTIAFANDAMLHIWGKDKSVRGKRFEEALPEMEGQEFTGLLKEVWRSGKLYEARDTAANIEVEGDLQTFYFDFVYRPILDATGNTYAIIHTATEVSDRMLAWKMVEEKHYTEQQLNEEITATNEDLKIAFDKLADMEQRLYQLVSTSPVGMTVLDGNELVIQQANTHIRAIWGRTSEQVIGKKLLEVFPELRDQPFPQMLSDVLSTGRSVSSKEIAVDIADINGNVSSLYVDFAYEPLRDAQGKVTSVLVTVSDISAIVNTRQQLAASERLLSELNEELAASNEEYQATNEELTSLNEENSTLNEELNAANEQLYSLSRELEKANELLTRSNAGLQLENAALLASEEKALALFADAPVAIGLLNGRDLIVESANTDLLKLWGKSAAVVGLPLSEALPELQGQPFLGILDNVFTTGEAFYGTETKAVIVYEGRPADRFFNFVYKPIKNESGQTHYIMIVAIDVTEQVMARQVIEQAEKKFRLIADNISQFAWMADSSGSVYWYNQRWFDYTGSDLKSMQGWGWEKVHHPDHVDRVVKKIKQHFKSGEEWEDTFPLRRADGEYRWFLSRMIPTKDASGNVINWFGTNTDITEQRKLDEQKDDFMSIASHELKTPVTSLKGNLQLLERLKNNLGNPIVPKMIESANKSMLKINNLVDDLLNINRFSEGRLELQKPHFTVWKMLELCCNYVRAEQKYELVIQGDKDITIYADEHRIDQVVVNFVNNAVKYASESKLLKITAQAFQKSKYRIYLTVTGGLIMQDNIIQAWDLGYLYVQKSFVDMAERSV